MADTRSVKKSRRHKSAGQFFSPRNIGVVYVWILAVILFTILKPDVFPTSQTAASIVNQYAITGMVALSLVVPLAAGVYDLSVGFVVGLSGVLCAYLLSSAGMSPVAAILVTMCACVLIGVFNAIIVVLLNVDSFIGTLGSGAIIAAITTWISRDQIITGTISESSFRKLASAEVLGVTLPVIYLLVIMLAIGYFLERTQSGRRTYATGFDRETARLNGAPVDRLVALSLVGSAMISGFAGIVLAARISAGSPGVGSSYLIPAFSAAFLGATQLRGGRFNPWGTVLGVILLGTGNVGLIIAGGPTWTPELFEGIVLIVAIALTSTNRETFRRAFRRRRSASPAKSGPQPGLERSG